MQYIQNPYVAYGAADGFANTPGTGNGGAGLTGAAYHEGDAARLAAGCARYVARTGDYDNPLCKDMEPLTGNGNGSGNGNGDDSGNGNGNGNGVALRDRWANLPSWGQYALGGVAVVGSIVGLNALARRFY